MRRLLPLVAAALAAGGCGGSSAPLGDAAKLVPADASVFVAVRTSSDWRPFARQLLGRAPAVPRGAHDAAFAVVHGNVVVIDADAAAPAHALADSPAYRDAVNAIPDGADAIGYTTGADAARRLLELPGQVQVTSNPVRFRTVAHPHGISAIAELHYRWGVAWQTSDGGGARAKSAGLPVATSQNARGIQQLVPAYTPTLFDEIPADALAVVDFPLGSGSIESLPTVPKLVTTIFHGTRYDLPLDLDAILQGETAIYLRRGGEVTVVSSPQDTAAAAKALQELLALRNAPYDAVRVYRATIGGQLVISTAAKGIATFRGGGDKLSSKLDLPDQVEAAVYVAPGAQGALKALGLQDVRPLTAWALADGNDPTLTIRFARDSG